MDKVTILGGPNNPMSHSTESLDVAAQGQIDKMRAAFPNTEIVLLMPPKTHDLYQDHQAIEPISLTVIFETAIQMAKDGTFAEMDRRMLESLDILNRT